MKILIILLCTSLVSCIRYDKEQTKCTKFHFEHQDPTLKTMQPSQYLIQVCDMIDTLHARGYSDDKIMVYGPIK
jgi:hypothetical protein